MIKLSLLGVCLYAIIGGPSSGKTSITEELKAKGKDVIDEAASIIIKKNIAKGNLHPWGEVGFQTDIFNLQLNLENKALKSGKDHVFVDRGILDSLVYLKLRNQKNTEEYFSIKKLIEQENIANRYRLVFFIEPHSRENFESLQAETRCETTEESLLNSKAIFKEYSKYYDLINIAGNLTVKERANLILEKIDALK
jgi:predicted ATPase